MAVYLDNAATTPVAPEVLQAMIPYLSEVFGNPSSTHAFGRKARASIEKSRVEIAKCIGATAAEVIFTSGGTEADNQAILSAIRKNGVERIISSKLEHHAILHSLDYVPETVEVDYVRNNELGVLDLAHLEELIKASSKKTLVTIMHANNEVGNVNPIDKIGAICKAHDALFHTDSVQTVGHLPIDVRTTDVDMLSGAAHKFNGPKGIGFLYARKGVKVCNLIHGGAQEKEKRGGTENVAAIVGMATALCNATKALDSHRAHTTELKEYFRAELLKLEPNLAFNGADTKESLYTVLSVNFPAHPRGDMLLFNLDIEGVACSGGSACSSGSNKGSHVLAELKQKNDGPNARFSFNYMNTKAELDTALAVIKKVWCGVSV